MAPFEWITPEQVMKWVGAIAGFGFLGLGVLTLYVAVNSPAEFVLFGVDVLLLVGVSQVLTGLYFLFAVFILEPRIYP